MTVANPRRADQLAAFEAALPRAQGMIGSGQLIDEALLPRAPRLEVISSISVGVDNYSIPALRVRGIVLCHTPGVLTETTADTIFSLIMATSRRLVELANLVRDGHWTATSAKTCSAGTCTARRWASSASVASARRSRAARRWALACRCCITTATRWTCRPWQGSPTRRCDELLERADIVAVVLPLTDATRGLMGPREFALMKPGAIFVNGARGAIVQEPALLDALEAGTLRAAGLDVFATEPLPLDSPLRTHPRVTCLPHIGSATHETRQAMAGLATTNLLQALAGQQPLAVYPLDSGSRPG